MSRVSVEGVVERLVGYGLSEIEAKIFVHLSRFGPCGAKSVTNTLKISRAKAYRLLKEMQAKGVIEATLDYPMKFSARRLEEVLDSAVQDQRRRIATLEEEKGVLLASWKSLDTKESAPFEEKFQIVKGIRQAYDRAINMLEESVTQVRVISLGADLLQGYYQTDFLERLQELAKEKAVLFLTRITRENAQILKDQSAIEVRHIRDLSPSLPNFVMRDDAELIIFTKSSEREGSAEAIAMWTNSRALTQSMSALFNGMWIEAAPLSEVISNIMSSQLPDDAVMVEGARELNVEVENAKRELASILQKYGFIVSESCRVRGKSGVFHIFDLRIQVRDRVVLMDFAFSEDQVSVQPVLALFVKKMDCEGPECDYVLVVKPSLSAEARRLAKLYQIRFRELSQRTS